MFNRSWPCTNRKLWPVKKLHQTIYLSNTNVTTCSMLNNCSRLLSPATVLNHLTRAQNGQIRISIDGPLQFCTLYVGLSPANDITSFDPLSIHISISIWVPHHRHWYGTQSKARDDQEDQGSPGVTHWQRTYTTFQWHKMALEKLQMTGHSGEAVSLNVWTD